MKRLLPLLLMTFLVGACGGATPAAESPVAEVTPTPSPTPVPTPAPITLTTIDARWSSYGETGFVAPDEALRDEFSIGLPLPVEQLGIKRLSSGVSVAGSIIIGSDDELGVGNYTDPAFDLFGISGDPGPFMGEWERLPGTLGEFCANPGTFTARGETGGDGVGAKWTFETKPAKEATLFGRPAKGFSYLAPYSDFQGVTSDDGKIFDHLFGVYYCVEVSDLIADDLRLEDDRGNALYLIYHVEAIADARDFTASERAAIAAEGFGVPASITGATPLLVQQAVEE